MNEENRLLGKNSKIGHTNKAEHEIDPTPSTDDEFPEFPDIKPRSKTIMKMRRINRYRQNNDVDILKKNYDGIFKLKKS
jgi:hypothetical protein